MRNIVGRQVRQARLDKKPKMTQKQLATQLQLAGMTIDRAGVAKIEAGIREVTDIEVMLLARALTVSIAWLMDTSN